VFRQVRIERCSPTLGRSYDEEVWCEFGIRVGHQLLDPYLRFYPGCGSVRGCTTEGKSLRTAALSVHDVEKLYNNLLALGRTAQPADSCSTIPGLAKDFMSQGEGALPWRCMSVSSCCLRYAHPDNCPNEPTRACNRRRPADSVDDRCDIDDARPWGGLFFGITRRRVAAIVDGQVSAGRFSINFFADGASNLWRVREADDRVVVRNVLCDVWCA